MKLGMLLVFVIVIGISFFRSFFKLCFYLLVGLCCWLVDCVVDGFIGIVVCSLFLVRVCVWVFNGIYGGFLLFCVLFFCVFVCVFWN